MTRARVQVGDFEADLAAGELWRGAERVRIQDLPFRLLALLLDRPGEIVTRAEIGQRLWPDGTFVDFEAGVNTAITKLRDALDDRADAPRYIETIPKRGYRLIALVRPSVPADVAVPSAGLPSSSVAPVRRRVAWPLIAGLVVLTAGAAAWRWWPSPKITRVAVVKFDNETGRPDLDRLAQTMTDSTVLALGKDPRLAVIGNAAVLRTDRPFRDLLKIRDALDADLIVVGQVQLKEDGLRVMAHLIRAADQAHVWVEATPLAAGEEIAAETRVVTGITTAVRAHHRPQ